MLAEAAGTLAKGHGTEQGCFQSVSQSLTYPQASPMAGGVI